MEAPVDSAGTSAPKKRRTVGLAGLPEWADTETSFGPVGPTLGALKDGRGSPAATTWPDALLLVPKLVKSPIPIATASTTPTSKKIFRGFARRR